MMNSEKTFPLLPVTLAVLILCACAWLGWLLYGEHLKMKEEAAARNAEYAALQNREEELRKALALSPCEAREKFGPEALKEER